MKLVLSPKYGDTVYDGQVTEIGTVENANAKAVLAYHWYTNKFLFACFFKSGKVSVDHMTRIDHSEGIWSTKNTVEGSMNTIEIARHDRLKGSRILRFDSKKMAYVVETITTDKNYEIWYWLKEK